MSQTNSPHFDFKKFRVFWYIFEKSTSRPHSPTVNDSLKDPHLYL